MLTPNSPKSVQRSESLFGWLCLVVVVGSLTACGTIPADPIEVDDQAFRSEHRADHEAWGPLSVRHVRDERPGWELGRFNYLNESYFSEELFRLPVPAVLKRVLYREIKASGSFSPRQDLASSHYLVDITIHHYYLKTDRDLIGVIPVLPVVSTEIYVDIEIKLTDVDGRLFLNRRYDSSDPAQQDLFANVSGSGADQLVGITAAFLNQMIADLDHSIPRFWAELGRSVPKPGAE